jgi:hypothetical protein
MSDNTHRLADRIKERARRTAGSLRRPVKITGEAQVQVDRLQADEHELKYYR